LKTRRTKEGLDDVTGPGSASDPGLCIWVPPGVTPLVSAGVTVRLIGAVKELVGKVDRRTEGVQGDDTLEQRPVAQRLWGVPPRQEPPAQTGERAPGIWWQPSRSGVRSTALWERRSGTAEEEEAPADLTVPPELEAEAHEAMKHWDMRVTGMQVMATKPEKGGAIWRIETNRGPRSLKRLHRPPARSLFSIGLQDYVVRQGARVPKLIPTRNGKLFAEIQGRLWIVTEWIEGLTQAPKDLEGAKILCYGLGEFHRHSRGYEPPPGAEVASRLHRWPRTYRKMATKMGWFREVARLYPDAPASATVLALVDRFEEQARRALARLEASPYARLAARGGPAWGVVHQDYGWSNGQIGPGGVWIIDLDGVAYDLPIRDLRKLITSTMDDMGVWDPAWMRAMIEAYHEANPIEPDLYQVLLIDMSLPNEFYKHVKDMLMDPLTFLSPELDQLLQRLVAAEETKWKALKELGLDASSTPAPASRGRRVGR